jgi:two-component sensor histidine kinase
MSPSDLSPDGVMTERLVLRELSHEIDDELASAIDLVSVAASRCNSVETRSILVSLQDRLQGHAQVHRSLQMPEYTTTIDLATYLQHLCQAISRSRLEGEGIALSLLLHPVRMSSERCRLLGLIVFELITNAARHSFGGGVSSIRLAVWPTATSVECYITDSGTSNESADRESGRSLVDVLAASLHGTVDIHFGSNETRIAVSIPRTA